MAPTFAPPLHLASFAAASSSAVKVAPVHTKPRRKAQVALAVDGEGLWRYDVETLHPTWSFTVPPATTFASAPLTVASASSPTTTTPAAGASAAPDDLVTLASTSAPSSELWAFRTEAAGKEAVGGLPKGHAVVGLFSAGAADGSSWALAVSSPVAAPGSKGKAREYAVVSLSAPSLALSSLALPKAYAPPPSAPVHMSTHPSSAFPALALAAHTTVLLEVFARGEVRAWAVSVPDGSGMTARKGALELVLQGGPRAEWEDGEKAVDVALVEGAAGGQGVLQILTDRSHLHAMSLALAPLSAPLSLLTPPPHALAALAPYALVLTPGQLHFVSPLFTSVVHSAALPAALSSALALGSSGKVAFVGRKADKYGIWLAEVGLTRASGAVGEVMFTKEQTAKVLGPVHPAVPSDAKASGGQRTSSAARGRHFDGLLAKADWDALLALVVPSSALPATALTAVLSALFALEAAPFLAKAKPAEGAADPPTLTKERLVGAFVRVVRDDGEWKAAVAGLAEDVVVELIAMLGGWVAELGDVSKQAQWADVGKAVPALAELVPLLTLLLDTHLPALLANPTSSALLRPLSAALRTHIRLQRELADTAALVDGAKRVLRGAERQRARDKKAGGAGTAGGSKRRGAKGAGARDEWQGVYRVEEFVL